MPERRSIASIFYGEIFRRTSGRPSARMIQSARAEPEPPSAGVGRSDRQSRVAHSGLKSWSRTTDRNIAGRRKWEQSAPKLGPRGGQNGWGSDSWSAEEANNCRRKMLGMGKWV